MAVNKLLEQRNNNSSELLEQLDAYETFEEINRRIEREQREWRSSLDRQIDGYYDYNEIEQELRDAGKIDDRPWWRRLLRL
jgi:chromatin segregation and condensation protein Rec8/ScpA/Scc1 (kleisin family)